MDYLQEYQKAETAYMQGRYEEAAAIVDPLVEDFPSEPNAHLLRGHIYCYGLQQYETAIEEYESVLAIATEEVLVNYANDGIDYASQFTSKPAAQIESMAPRAVAEQDSAEVDEQPFAEKWEELPEDSEFVMGFDSIADSSPELTSGQEISGSFASPFDVDNYTDLDSDTQLDDQGDDNPFADLPESLNQSAYSMTMSEDIFDVEEISELEEKTLLAADDVSTLEGEPSSNYHERPGKTVLENPVDQLLDAQEQVKDLNGHQEPHLKYSEESEYASNGNGQLHETGYLPPREIGEEKTLFMPGIEPLPESDVDAAARRGEEVVLGNGRSDKTLSDTEKYSLLSSDEIFSESATEIDDELPDIDQKKPVTSASRCHLTMARLISWTNSMYLTIS
ncbi:MAG: hypothetical protein GDA43_23155 [Hormoscilla sp. SP5CHS1]|nr:hypothetical protein [Hormoscilla sp. SP12CHS1]MBC6455717.1 hypothetical protein [Hormoscilla sp. SP5CHS1]